MTEEVRGILWDQRQKLRDLITSEGGIDVWWSDWANGPNSSEWFLLMVYLKKWTHVREFVILRDGELHRTVIETPTPALIAPNPQ